MKTTIYPILNQPLYDSAYSAIVGADNDDVFFALCTHMPDTSAGMFKLNLRDGQGVKFLYDMSEPIKSSVAHGKVHTKLVTGNKGELYFATHFAYPYGLPQPYSYEGGRLLVQNTSGEVQDLGIAQADNGVIDIAVDNEAMLVYMLTIPAGHLIQYDLNAQKFTDLGAVPLSGSICRSITISPEGTVYGSYDGGGVFVYSGKTDKFQLFDNVLPSADEMEWDSASRGGVNRLGRTIWRNANFDARRKKIYGLLSTQSLGFCLNPETMRVETFDKLLADGTDADSDQIYPTLSMTTTQNSLAYISSVGLFDYCRSENVNDWCHMLVLDKDSGKKIDLGLISDNGRKVYGASAAAALNDNELVFIGAVEAKPGESYNPFNIINQQPFQLAVIHIALDLPASR